MDSDDDSDNSQMFADYDDTELGALDLEEIEGFMPESHAMLLKAAEEFEESRRRILLDKEHEVARMRRLQEIQEESEDEIETVEVDPKEKWDCETILSTYSTLYNHPKIIEEPKKPKKIQIHAKTGIPKDVLEYRKERRVEKKANKEAFKEEKKRQEKIMLNNRNNVQGNKIM
ncbi:Uncharacterized protein OBRU01_20817, partial [Operophtera brumata]